MGVSIYYTATRSNPLTPKERERIKRLVAEFSVDDQIDAYLEHGVGWNGEPFCIYDPADPSETDVIFEGATKLPLDDDQASDGFRHWCNLLSLIRLVLPGALWHVHVDDIDLVWDEKEGKYRS